MTDQIRQRSVGAPAARSMLLTVLGEYVLPRGPGAAVWQETLVGALGVLGYKTQAARQALARSARGGWLATERAGRRVRMRLTKETAQLLRDGAERIYHFGEPWSWDGRWLVVVVRVPENRREIRHQLRTRLAWAGFGSLGGGVWLSPHIEHEPEIAGIRDEAAAEVTSFRAELGDLGDPQQLVRAAWDLGTVAEHYRTFVADFNRLRPSEPAAFFRAQTTLVHAWRKFPFIDPDLPKSLLPSRWPGERAHALFERQHDRWGADAQRYFEWLMDPDADRRAAA